MSEEQDGVKKQLSANYCAFYKNCMESPVVVTCEGCNHFFEKEDDEEEETKINFNDPQYVIAGIKAMFDVIESFELKLELYGGGEFEIKMKKPTPVSFPDVFSTNDIKGYNVKKAKPNPIPQTEPDEPNSQKFDEETIDKIKETAKKIF